MKKLMIATAVAIITLSFCACQTAKTASTGTSSGECGNCCKSDSATAKKPDTK
jgi:hypothetical protein